MADKTKKLLTQMLRNNCALYASEFLRGPTEAPYNGRFFIAQHHEAWAQLVNEHKQLCINAARDHGKCMTGDARILTPSGDLVRHDEWTGGKVLSWCNGRFEVFEATPAEPQGPRATLRITTRTGRTMTVTRNHPLLTQLGWQPAEDLVPGDAIAAPRSLATFGSKSIQSPWLLGMLIGDGCCHAGTTPTVSTGDQVLVFELEKEASARGWDLMSRGPYTFALSAHGKKRSETAKHWLRELGLLGHTAYDKTVPCAVFTAPQADVCEFLAGYLDSDGSINLHGGGSIEYYSVNEGLLRDTQHLLMRLGVTSTLAPKKGRYKGQVHWSWRLTIRSYNILRFAKLVRPRGERRTQLEALTRFLEPRARPEPTSSLLWDTIDDIEDAGEQEVYAIHVPGPENYVANDVVQHNSFFFTLAYPIWQAERHPGKRGFILSGSQPQAERILLDIQQEIENNDKLRHLLPDTRDRRMWSSKQLRLANGHEIYARGYGTKVRGAHPVWLVVDDGLNDDDAYSERVRQKNIDYFYNALRNMVIPGGQTVVIGTPYHRMDLYGELAKNSEWHFARFPAILDYNTKQERALWPERYNLETLYKRRAEIGAVRFSRELLCLPVADDMSLFPSYMFRSQNTELFHQVLGAPLTAWAQYKLKSVFMGVDFAVSANVGTDYTVIWVMGVDEFGNRYIMDIIREHGLDFTAQKTAIVNTARKYRPALVYLESNQAQRIFGDELMRETDLPIKLFHTGSEKNELEKGVPALRVLFENNKVRIPRGDKRSVDATDIWVEEMRNMTFANGKVTSTGEHDDTVMAFWICNRAVMDANFSFAFGEQDGDKEAYDENERQLKETEEEDEDYDYVLGAVPRMGRPRKINAQLVDGLGGELDSGVESESKETSSSEFKPYEEVRPTDKIPSWTDIIGLGRRY